MANPFIQGNHRQPKRYISSLGFVLPITSVLESEEPPGLLVVLLHLPLQLLGFEGMQLGMVVVDGTKEGNPVAEEIDGGDGVADDGPGEVDEEPIFYDADDIYGEGRGLSDEQEEEEVEGECAEGVCAEDDDVRTEGGLVTEDGYLDERSGDEANSHAAGGDVLEQGDGVEGDALGGEEDLDEDGAGDLVGDDAELDHNAPESGLAVGGDGDRWTGGEEKETTGRDHRFVASR
ncbi:hypothetical protein Cni_G16739 [Canna indica]|uniref:Uncharacterized protein n=1 Tax=Canna indica TaxID=4628 RepID=A0AAQ3KJ53_9LILI|nr:hypothetical protein Cni_G16739 [Canna indica]